MILTVRTPGKARPRAGHRKITITSGADSLTLPITNTETQHSGQSNDYVVIKRDPNLPPLLLKAGSKLPSFVQGVIFDYHGREVETDLQKLRGIAYSPYPIHLGYGALEAGRWRITDLTIRSVYREQGSNKMTRAEVQLTFTRQSDTDATAINGGRDPRIRTIKPLRPTYTWHRGDTLAKLGQAVYRDPNIGGLVAVYNHKPDPRKIKPGTVLKCPVFREAI